MKISDRDRSTLAKAKKTGEQLRTTTTMKNKGHTIEEIATALDVPVSRVRSLIRRFDI